MGRKVPAVLSQTILKFEINIFGQFCAITIPKQRIRKMGRSLVISKQAKSLWSIVKDRYVEEATADHPSKLMLRVRATKYSNEVSGCGTTGMAMAIWRAVGA